MENIISYKFSGRSGQAGQTGDCLHREVVQARPGEPGAGPAVPGEGAGPRGGEGLLCGLLLYKVSCNHVKCGISAISQWIVFFQSFWQHMEYFG